jgi:hypothetical protein
VGRVFYTSSSAARLGVPANVKWLGYLFRVKAIWSKEGEAALANFPMQIATMPVLYKSNHVIDLANGIYILGLCFR